MKHIKIFILLASFFALSCGGSPGTPELDFVFQDSTELSEIKCYHLHPWSDDGEIHAGIDIIPKYTELLGTNNIKTVAIVAPASGEIEKFLEQTSGAGAKMYSYVIKINDYWRIVMSFEPQTSDAGIIAQQANNFFATEGSQVTKGDVIANLVYGKLLANHYPHIHFGILYVKPGDTIDGLAADILNVTRNNGIPTPPPRTGPSSPWEPTNLETASEFFCPYLYFSDEAQALLKNTKKYAANGDLCTCACAYNSSNGDCGDCAP